MFPARLSEWKVIRLTLAIAAFTAPLFLTPATRAQSDTAIQIDASQPYQEPGPALYDGGSAQSPSGRTIGVNSRYLTLDGKPWLPVMGEFHYTRYPESQWEEEILKMKAGGVNIVSTYVIWIHHEEIEGQFDWRGRRDLRAFTELCAKHGMYVYPRIGPWSHAEVRNGGLPDWLLKKGPTRQDDPVFMGYVAQYYAQIAQQLKGLLWKDGGPVIGIQLENEYAGRGPGKGDEYILALKKLAIKSGMDVPLYTVTGWDNAVVPRGQVIPVFGGYPDAPWDASTATLPPGEVYKFRFDTRVAGTMGMMDGRSGNPRSKGDPVDIPFVTAEIGGGIEDTYHRRPVIQPDDIAAMLPVMLGSGVNLYGTYMFQGGENPEGKLTTLEESQATGYPTDVPIKSYDFQAPLGEFGQERESFRKLKVFQYFLNDFGDQLAPMIVYAPAKVPKNPADLTVPRASVRSRGDQGFIFFNNYVRGSTMPERPATQFEIRLPHDTLRVPLRPINIPSGAYFIWPFNLQTSGITLRYATAQLFTRLEKSGEGTTLYFAAIPGIAPEFAFDAADTRLIHLSSGESNTQAGVIYVSGIKPGIDSSIDLRSGNGREVRIVILSSAEAEDAWKLRVGGVDHLLFTSQDFFADEQGELSRIWLRSRGTPQFAFSITPPIPVPLGASLPLSLAAVDADVASYTAEDQVRSVELHYRQTHPAGTAPPVRIGPAPSWRPDGVAEAPSEAPFQQAAKWSIALPANTLKGLSNLYLKVKYEGDVARLNSTGGLLVDNFFNGQPWTIGLKRFLDSQGPTTLQLEILPLRADAPIFLEPADRPQIPAGGQIDKLESLQLLPEYQLTLTAHDH